MTQGDIGLFSICRPFFFSSFQWIASSPVALRTGEKYLHTQYVCVEFLEYTMWLTSYIF